MNSKRPLVVALAEWQLIPSSFIQRTRKPLEPESGNGFGKGFGAGVVGVPGAGEFGGVGASPVEVVCVGSGDLAGAVGLSPEQAAIDTDKNTASTDCLNVPPLFLKATAISIAYPVQD
ncbi:MAG: hypothetical protein KW793_04350 [Candidatus Doudnabacteria bacterium]|nr:hypothetical protein [Candidatus Doudnabacteria bacterium]